MNFMSGRPGAGGAGGGGFYEEISSSDGGEFPPNYPYRRNQPYSVSNAGAGEETGEDQAQYGGGGEGSSGGRAAVIEREHMFDKVVTPSDVGKLNRLVIPKQHAEKYFPLDSAAHEKGLLLNFEDRNGKPWRFRYSYWNSSQSYVMTKGWSRFVKEKKLDAGDIVSFQRGVGDHAKDRLFIDWRRRPDAPEIHPPPNFPIPIQFPSYEFSFHRPWTNPFFMHPPQPPRSDYSHFLHHHHPSAAAHASAYGGGSAIVNGNPCPPGSIVYLRSSGAEAFTTAGRQFEIGSGGGGGAVAAGGQQTVFNAVPVVQGKAAAKRLRLFGVNMDCPISDESDDCQMLASTNSTAPLPLPPPPDDYSSPSSSTFPRHSDHSHKGKGSISLDLDI